MIATENKIKTALEQTGSKNIDSLLHEKGLIIEFVGPPGSGKTTNCNCAYELLKQANVNVYVFKDIKEYFYNLSYPQKIYRIVKTIIHYGLDFIYFSLQLILSGVFSFDSCYRYIKLCVFNIVLHEFIQIKKADVVLLDQWIIQGLWSATIFKRKSFDKLPPILGRLYFRTDYVLYFTIDAATASNRIASRNSGRSRFDKMDAEKRLAELNTYANYLWQLYKNSDCPHKYIFSTIESPDKNANDFLHLLENSIRNK